MILSSENKHFHNIGARLSFVDLPSTFEEPACEKPNLWGTCNFFLIICPKVARRMTSGELSSGSSRVQGGEK